MLTCRGWPLWCRGSPGAGGTGGAPQPIRQVFIVQQHVFGAMKCTVQCEDSAQTSLQYQPVDEDCPHLGEDLCLAGEVVRPDTLDTLHTPGDNGIKEVVPANNCHDTGQKRLHFIIEKLTL